MQNKVKLIRITCQCIDILLCVYTLMVFYYILLIQLSRCANTTGVIAIIVTDKHLCEEYNGLIHYFTLGWRSHVDWLK